MIGDKLLITAYHEAAARLVLEHLKILDMEVPFSISISGESGSGKSEIAEVLRRKLSEEGKRVLVLGQDDYFRLPPHSNHKQRKIDINWVGPMEVQLRLMSEHAKTLCSLDRKQAVKPLVYFSEDKIGTETLTGPYDVVIAEGTYTSLLEDIHVRVFIDGDYRETKLHRLSRNRDQSLEDNQDYDLKFLEQVLEIEHQIISKHKNLAHVVIPPEKDLMKAE
jgi:uridine kinase